MSVPAWYDNWAVDHSVAFGFGTEQTKTVMAWGPVLAQLFTEQELRAATARMIALEDAPKFASDHRSAIIRTIQNARTNAGRKANTSSLVSGKCRECDGCGIVVVPHPGTTDDYPPRMREILPMPRADPTGLTRTMGVCCVCCEAGHRTRAASEHHGRPLATMIEYERAYPNWRQVQAERLKVLNASRTPPTAADIAELERTLKSGRERAAQRERVRAAG